MPYERLPESVNTLYAELFELAIHAEATRAAAGIPPGSFVSKEIRGQTYWYLQQSVGGEKTQQYLGPESPTLLGWMDKVREARGELAEDTELLGRLASMLAAGGAHIENAAMIRVLELLADAGVFRLGGVLVGTHAFSTTANLLGVRFEHQSLKTQDVDIAQDPAIAVALLDREPRADIAEALTGSELPFHAVPSLDPRRPSTSFKIRGRELRVDFLTPLRGPDSSRPVFLKSLQVSAFPLRLLDYLIETPVQAIVLGRRRPVLVQVPEPARFVLHKLWTSGRRDVSSHAKVAKDLRQAGQLAEVLLDERPDDLTRAWQALKRHGKARRQIRRTLEKLEGSVGEALGELLRAV